MPPSIYIAIGAVLAALVAGFFSFLNLVSSKENKVSEFRQLWIDGIRIEISEYTGAMQALARFRIHKDKFEKEEDFLKLTEQSYKVASESLSKIQMRLNPAHSKDNPNSSEAKLLGALFKARENFNKQDFMAAFKGTDDIRDAAAPFLKCEWERVKNGEAGYQNIRNNALRTIKSGILLVVLLAIAAFIFQFKTTFS